VKPIILQSKSEMWKLVYKYNHTRTYKSWIYIRETKTL